MNQRSNIRAFIAIRKKETHSLVGTILLGFCVLAWLIPYAFPWDGLSGFENGQPVPFTLWGLQIEPIPYYITLHMLLQDLARHLVPGFAFLAFYFFMRGQIMRYLCLLIGSVFLYMAALTLYYMDWVDLLRASHSYAVPLAAAVCFTVYMADRWAKRTGKVKHYLNHDILGPVARGIGLLDGDNARVLLESGLSEEQLRAMAAGELKEVKRRIIHYSQATEVQANDSFVLNMEQTA